MIRTSRRLRYIWLAFAGGVVTVFSLSAGDGPGKAEFEAGVKPLIAKYCLECHSTKAKKGSLDLERFARLEDVRRDVKPWQAMIEQIETGEMPPAGKPQPSAVQKKQLLAWVRSFLDSEARARTGDPGHVPLRRLSNAEYDATIRDLTLVELRPAREFPADSAAGEGFTNAAEALSDISPPLFARYLKAAKDIADHAVLLPDGFRFSPSKTRRDWTDEGTASLRKYYAASFPGDGKLVFQPYLLATVRHRDAFAAGKFEETARKESLNEKYLRILWATLTDRKPSQPLDAIRAKWRSASEKEVAGLAAEVSSWQSVLWTTVKVGNYIRGSWGAPEGSSYIESLSRQAPFDPPVSDSIALRYTAKAAPGQTEHVLILAADELGGAGPMIWHRPRFEAKGKPALLLRDYEADPAAAKSGSYGLPKDRFDSSGSIVATTDRAIEIRLPAALFKEHEFVVDAKLPAPSADRLVRVRAGASAGPWNPAVLGSLDGSAYKQLISGYAEFRRVFPLFVCFPQVVPTDEVVTLKMFHREDEPLERLFLTNEQARQLDRLWAEQRFISRQPVAEFDYLPQFMGYTTQDTPKALQQFFIDRKPLFQKHAEGFLKAEEAAIPKQLEALVAFAERAYRRPLEEKEKADLGKLYGVIRGKGAAHDEAFRGVLARVLTSPAFLFRIEASPKGNQPAPVSDWELATRLSYFLWSSMPDEELRRLAATGKLQDPKVLAAQAERMLRDARTRSLAIEFGAQWIHVRGFDELKEKNEKLFPTFDANLRRAIYEETILFFQDLFQGDRPVTNVLDADYTFLNETLARHYGIPGVTGPQWRKVEGVRKYGRGGILGLASVHAKQSGASRTSPVLRGNWVVETLLGEKLPRPPANVPVLPDQEGTDKLTTRQMVEQHVSNPSCAACHVRIDPYGFAFENFDAIGRYRVKEISGHPVDTRAKLNDGTEFEGLGGLRSHLMTKKKDVIVRLFCQRLLGYALGRATTLSDTTLIDEMVAELHRNGGRISAAVLTIVRSPQFRMIRGREFAGDGE